MGRRKRAERKGIPKDRLKEQASERQQRDAALAALKVFQRQGSFKGRPPELADTLSDESDRGAVILVGCLIEDLLADRIIEKLPEGEKRRDDLLKLGGVLNSFQDKLTMGLALGIIDDDIADNLNILRIMRNACAHSKLDINLRTPQLQDVFCLLLDEHGGEVVRKPLYKGTARVIFNFIAIYHFEVLLGGTKQQAQAVFNFLLDDSLKQAEAEVEKRRASLERRPARSKKAGPPKDQKGLEP